MPHSNVTHVIAYGLVIAGYALLLLAALRGLR
jgi:hypothetical protein